MDVLCLAQLHACTHNTKSVVLTYNLLNLTYFFQAKAKKCGLWNLFLPLDSDPSLSYGAGLTNLEYSHLAELMGHSLFGSEVQNVIIEEMRVYLRCQECSW